MNNSRLISNVTLAQAFTVAVPALCVTAAWANGPTPVPASPVPTTIVQPNSQPIQVVPTDAPKAASNKPLSGGVSRSAHQHSHNTGAFANAKHRQWSSGPLLLSPLEDQVVETPYGKVCIADGSVVLLIVDDKELAVYNLHDTHKDAVLVEHANGIHDVAPECVIVLGKSSLKTFQEANPAPFVAYRRVSISNLSDDMRLFQAEFDFGSMTRLPALRELLVKKDAKTQKSMGGMLKTAAIMVQVSQSSEPYGYYVTDRVRAISAKATEGKP